MIKKTTFKAGLLHTSILATIAGIGIATPAFAQVSDTPVPAEERPAADSQDAPEGAAIVVSAVRFQSNEASSALKVPLSIKDTPQTVLAVTRDVIDFATIRTFEDIYKIDASGGTSHSIDSFPRNYYRGFKQQGNNAIKIDGFRMPADVQLDLAPYERFEIIKGSTSTMYGQNSVAGTLNAISKNPQKQFGGEFQAEAGSFNHYRVTADVYGPITADGSLAFRVIGAALDDKSYLDLAYKRVKLIAPTLSYEFSPDTTITARVNYQDHKYRYHFGNGLQFTGADLDDAKPGDFIMPDLPRSEFFGQEWNVATKEAFFAQTTLEHRFGNGWKLRLNAQYSHVNEYSAADSEQAPLADGTTLYSALYTNEKEDELYAGEVQLFGDVELFGTRNTIFLGADYYQQEGSRLQGHDEPVTGFNVFNPDYNLIPPHLKVSDYDQFSYRNNRVKGAGATVQLFLRPVDGLTVLLGGRYSYEKLVYDHLNGNIGDPGITSLGDFMAAPRLHDESKTNKLTWQLGTTYAITPQINVYASYGETFEPAVGVYAFDPNNPRGTPIDPEEGTSYEAGLKGEFFNKQLSASLAVFDMKRSNISQYDRATLFYIPLGTQHSRGVEFEAQGRVTRGWNVFLSAALMKAQYEKGRFDGYRPTNSPRFGLSLFSTYQVLDGDLKGLGVGAGVVHKGGRTSFGTDFSYADGTFVSYDFGDYTEVDARIFYDLGAARIQLGVTNLFDAKYYSPTHDRLSYGVHVNPPRQFTVKTSFRF